MKGARGDGQYDLAWRPGMGDPVAHGGRIGRRHRHSECTDDRNCGEGGEDLGAYGRA